tara:strand:- start:238 stop:879 length:642 start_codon:yes stop_codon:yes gene_type:complete
MQLHVTDNKFDTNPYYSERIKSVFACPPKETVELFDQNGYDLTRLEQLYAVANGANTTKHRNSEHITLRQEWFVDDNPEAGPHINHAFMFERKGYTGDALQQLKSWAEYRPNFHKLIAMRPKWGLDFSIDYCDREGNVFELLHWEYDGFEYNEIAGKKENMEAFLLNQDWDERAKTMLERKDEWHRLGFFEQSEWKTKFFGIDKERFKMVLWK